MSDQAENEHEISDEITTSDSESDSESSDMDEDSSDTDEIDGVVGEDNAPFRFIFDEEARARSLDGLAYGIDKNGHYFVICEDGDTVRGLLVHTLIERNVEDGILLPISKPGAKSAADTKEET